MMYDEPQAGGLIDKYYVMKLIIVISSFVLFLYFMELILK